MKKVGKFLILLLILGSFGIGGFYMGANSGDFGGLAGAPAKVSDDDKRILDNITKFKDIIKEEYIFDYSEDKIEAGIYKGLFASLGDPYSEFYTGKEFKALMEDTSGEFAGIGIVVSVGEDNLITVVSPIAGTPGDKAGIKAGDKVIAVNGVTYLGTEMQQAVEQMRGQAGEEVVITIRRTVGDKITTEDIKVVREMIHIDSVKSEMLPNNVGYINIISFDEKTDKEFEEHLKKLQASGMERLIIDLRNNPGGLLNVCENIADRILDEGTIVTTVNRKGEETKVKSDAESKLDMPIAVLVNNGSASASEILLGALRDNKAAISVGTKTFGKGIVQQIYPLSSDISMGGFKLTMAEYLTPSGEKIHGVGITPDFVVELPADVTETGPKNIAKDVQLKKAVEEIMKLSITAPAAESSSLSIESSSSNTEGSSLSIEIRPEKSSSEEAPEETPVDDETPVSGASPANEEVQEETPANEEAPENVESTEN